MDFDNDELEGHASLIDRLSGVTDRLDFLLFQKHTNAILVILVMAGILTVIVSVSREGIITVPAVLYMLLGFLIGYWVS